MPDPSWRPRLFFSWNLLASYERIGAVSKALSRQRTVRDSAIVLRTYDLGETDRIVVALTPSHALVHAVAKGVRRSSSKFGARLEPFMLVDLEFAPGKKLATVSQVVTLKAYTAPIMADYGAFTVASVLVELAEQLVRHETEAANQFRLLSGALAALAAGRISPFRILDSYALRSLHLAGWTMALGSCAESQEHGPLTYFSPEIGLLCRDCGRSNRYDRVKPVSAELPPYLSALAAGDWPLVGQVAPGSLSCEARGLIMDYVQWQLERPLKSLALLEKEV